MREGLDRPVRSAGKRADFSFFCFFPFLLSRSHSNDRSAMPAYTQLPAHGDGDDDDASPPASPHLPALEYGAAAGPALGGDGDGQSDEEDVLMADGSRSRAHSHSHSLQRSPPVGGGGGAAAGWSMESSLRESFAGGQAGGSMRGGGRARLQPQPQPSDEEELKEEKREEPGTSQTHTRTN